MKYVRTKDGIYDTTKGLYTPSIKMFAIGTKTIYDDDIIKQADTIEELCDGFYNDILNDFDCFGFDSLYMYMDFDTFKSDWSGYRNQDDWNGDGYGFIKTDKGLIYVAKLNDKGELELLWK